MWLALAAWSIEAVVAALDSMNLSFYDSRVAVEGGWVYNLDKENGWKNRSRRSIYDLYCWDSLSAARIVRMESKQYSASKAELWII